MMLSAVNHRRRRRNARRSASRRATATCQSHAGDTAVTCHAAGTRQALLFAPCDGNEVQSFSFDETGSLVARGTNDAEGSDGYMRGGECVDIDSATMSKTQAFRRLQHIDGYSVTTVTVRR